MMLNDSGLTMMKLSPIREEKTAKQKFCEEGNLAFGKLGCHGGEFVHIRSRSHAEDVLGNSLLIRLSCDAVDEAAHDVAQIFYHAGQDASFGVAEPRVHETALESMPRVLARHLINIFIYSNMRYENNECNLVDLCQQICG